MHHLRFLRYVDEVARCGTIRQASENLHVAASAVNRRLQDIEDELGTPLFERLPRGMRLTAAGELFIRYVRERAAELERVRSEIEDLKGLRRGAVSLAASQALARTFLPEIAQAFRQKHPMVTFRIRIMNHVQAAAALRNLDTDLALVFNLESESDFRTLATAEQKLMALMHVEHPLARKPELRLRDCAEYPLVLPARGTGAYQMVSRFLARSSVRLQPVVESNSFELLRSFLLDRQSVTFQMAIGMPCREVDLLARHVEDRGFPQARLVLASLHGRRLPVIAHAFSEFLQERLAALQPAA